MSTAAASRTDRKPLSEIAKQHDRVARFYAGREWEHLGFGNR